MEEELSRSPVFRAWAATFNAAYEGPLRERGVREFPDWVLRLIYRQQEEA